MIKKIINQWSRLCIAIATLHNQWELSRLKRTTKSRQELRGQEVIVNGKKMNAIRWIEESAVILPKMYAKGFVVDHYHRMTRFYYLFDIPGANFYIRSMKRIMKYLAIRDENSPSLNIKETIDPIKRIEIIKR